MVFCIDCKKEISCGPRCSSCANINRKGTYFRSEKAKQNMRHPNSIPSPNKGKTWEMIIGEERTIELKKHLSDMHTGKKHAKETKEKMSIASKGVKKSESHRANLKKHLDNLRLQGIPKQNRISKPQRFFFDLIKSIWSDAILEYHIINTPYFADIFIPSENLIIEYDGQYWHTRKEIENPGFHKKWDEILKNKGYEIVHLSEHEFYLLTNNFRIVK